MTAEAGNDDFVFRLYVGATPTVAAADQFESYGPPAAGDTDIAGLPNNVQHDHWPSRSTGT
jgi:hypothetical protein